MKKLLIKLFFLSIPIWPVIISLVLIKWGGETKEFAEIYKAQMADNKILYGPSYFNKAIEYKVSFTLTKRTEVLAIGTSRVMQFHEESFSNSFYNAGGIITRLPQVPILLRFMLENKYQPKTIILGLDQFFFNPNWDKIEGLDYQYMLRIANPPEYSPPYKNIMLDILNGKIKLHKFSSPNIGINAKQNQNGFRFDGSYYYGSLILDVNQRDKTFSDARNRIKFGVKGYEYSENLNSKSISLIKEIINICSDNGIELIGIIPPYAPSIYEEIDKSGNYKYMKKIMPSIEPFFLDKKFQLYDFSTFSNSTDEDFYDGFHGNAELYKKIAETINMNKQQINK